MTVPNSPHSEAVAKANWILNNNPVFLDTETTGLKPESDEIIEISVVDRNGTILVNSLVKPNRSIPADATEINGITNEMVQKGLAWTILWTMQVRNALRGRIIVAYNSDFDRKMIEQSNRRYRISLVDSLQYDDLLALYSKYRNEWDYSRNRPTRYHSLDEAGKECGISLPNAHRALADTLLARELLFFIAGVKPVSS